MTGEAVLVSRRGNLTIITLNRPDKRNAINGDLTAGLDAALNEFEDDPGQWCAILTGGDQFFCAGADLSEGPGEPTSRGGIAGIITRTRSKPLIAAVEGFALGGGLELVLCCDLVIAAESARFGDAHANYGLLPGGGGSVRLPRKIGATRAKYLMYTGEFVSAGSMESAGLVNQVVEDAELDAVVDTLVKTMAAKSPLGLRRMKTLVNDGLEQPAEVALRQELLMTALHQHSEDIREGLAAFQEKRAPQFTGR